jgi:hypothetical protein
MWNSKSKELIRALAITVTLLSVSNVSAKPCPETVSQQDAWALKRVNQFLLKARVAYEDEKAEKAYDRELERLSKALKQCRMVDDASFAERYPEFVEYVRVLSLEHRRGHELGFEVPDRTYFEETKAYVTIPEFLLTPRFLRAVKWHETLDQAKSILNELNATRSPEERLLYFSYESRHLGTPDNDFSYRRLLIVVPGNVARNEPEKWVQFGIPDPKSKVPIRNLSVVSVVRGPGKTTNTFFKDYFRTYRRNGTITVQGRWELGQGDDNCLKCHKSGLLPIFPEDGSVSADEKAVVEAVNKRFLTYVAPRFGGYFDTSKLGPGLGSNRTTANANHATLATSCVACHQPDGLGSLNWPMDSVLISSFVQGGRMPFGSKLDSAGRVELYQQLVDDYFAIDEQRPGILKSWLLGRSR